MDVEHVHRLDKLVHEGIEIGGGRARLAQT
jgi:hypothetical protein